MSRLCGKVADWLDAKMVSFCCFIDPTMTWLERHTLDFQRALGIKFFVVMCIANNYLAVAVIGLATGLVYSLLAIYFYGRDRGVFYKAPLLRLCYFFCLLAGDCLISTAGTTAASSGGKGTSKRRAQDETRKGAWEVALDAGRAGSDAGWLVLAKARLVCADRCELIAAVALHAGRREAAAPKGCSGWVQQVLHAWRGGRGRFLLHAVTVGMVNEMESTMTALMAKGSPWGEGKEKEGEMDGSTATWFVRGLPPPVLALAM